MLRKKAAAVCSKHSEVEAVQYCKTCRKHMCEACKNAHDSFHSDDNHDVVPVASLTPFSFLDRDCPDHSNHQLELICNDCNGNIIALFIF